MKSKTKTAKVTRRTAKPAVVPPAAPIAEASTSMPTPLAVEDPKPAPAAAPAKTKAAPDPKATDFKVGTLVQFYCPSALRMMREKVTGYVTEHNWVTLESGRHFPAREVSPYVE